MAAIGRGRVKMPRGARRWAGVDGLPGDHAFACRSGRVRGAKDASGAAVGAEKRRQEVYVASTFNISPIPRIRITRFRL